MSLSRTLGLLACAGLIAGCASKSEDIQPSYISPLAYQNYSCEQVADEARRVSERVAQVTGVQDKKAKSDARATAVAVILFFPAALLIKGDKETAGELARLKGEIDALERVSVEKNCAIEFSKADAEA